jgi:uncharacterized protein DUF6328
MSSSELSPAEAAEYLLEECRMVLPGIQALFGFQLIAVFSAGFSERLSPGTQRLHLAACALVVSAIALIMTPAAYHRQRGAHQIRSEFVTLSSRLLLASMIPLAVAICLEFYVVASVIIEPGWARGLAAALGLLFAGLWLVLPRMRRVAAAR